MASLAALLRQPPRSFELAMSGLHQDIDVVSRAEGMSWAHHMVDFVQPQDYRALLGYLEAILTEERISNADLKGLMNRQQTAWAFRKSTDVRALFESVVEELRGRLELHG